MKLLDLLKKHMPDQSARSLKKQIDQNCCQINEKKERFASTIVGKGDVIIFTIPNRKNNSVILFDQSRILYENNDLLFYNKPAGLASDNKEFIQSIQGEHDGIVLLHRLDRDTTGILMFAKNPAVQNLVIGYFRKHQVKKNYFALVDGIPKQQKGLIDNYLGKKTVYSGQSIWGIVKSSEGLHAVTTWEVVAKGQASSLIRCMPKTGRTHQLRVHLSSIGHPILGDHQYGRRFHCSYPAARYLLHAAEIAFEHPIGNKISISAPIPQDFLKAMDDLKCAF